MKTWVVRLLSLWAFNVIVLLVIALVMGQVVAVGWSAPWAALSALWAAALPASRAAMCPDLRPDRWAQS